MAAKRGPKPKAQKNKSVDTKPVDSNSVSEIDKKDKFRYEEAADYFRVEVRAIRLWVAHGHLKKILIRGCPFVTRESILNCKFKPIGVNDDER